MSGKDEESAYSYDQPPAYDDTHQGVMSTASVLPTYSATMPADHMSPPPSYESVYGKMKAAKQESQSTIDFGKKFVVILCGTLGVTILLAVILAIPVAMLVMGALHKNHCPAEKMIPIYLIVGGCFGLLKNLSSLLQRCSNKDKDDRDEKNVKTNPFDSILNCFLLAWFIAGNVWIYRTYEHWSSDPQHFNYCNASLYWFAFWLTTAAYICIGATCCCVCIGSILAACCKVFE